MVVTTFIYAQSPDKMIYQAVVRGGDNDLAESDTIGMQSGIMQYLTTGNVVYAEIHTDDQIIMDW